MNNYLIPVLFSAFLLGIYDVFKKMSVKENSVMPVLFFATLSGSLFFILISALTGNFYAFASGCRNHHEFFLIILKSLLVSSSWICVYYAMRELPISIVSPIRATSPVWTFIGSIVLFSEIPTLYQGVGMLLIFIGYYLFSVIGKIEGINFLTDKSAHLIFFGTLLGAASALYDKYLLGIVKIPHNTVQFWFSVDLVVILGLAYFIRRCFFGNQRPFIWRYSIVATGILLILADYLYFYALSLPDTQIAIVSLVRRSSCVVTFLIGFSYFKDLNFKIKFASLLLILCGIVIISIFK